MKKSNMKDVMIMEKTLIQLIKEAASKLRDSKLKRLGGKEFGDVLEGIRQGLELDTIGEAIMFVALFDRNCANAECGINDIADYFGCSQLEIMEYVPSLCSLQEKRIVIQTNAMEFRIAHKSFVVNNYVVSSIVENRKLELEKIPVVGKELDRYDLCKYVDSKINDPEVSTEALFQHVESMEHHCAEMGFVINVKSSVSDITARTLFYEACYDHIKSEGNSNSHIKRTLQDMYDTFGIRLSEQKALIDGTHVLVKTGLVEVVESDEYLALTEEGMRMFFEDDYTVFTNGEKIMDRYSFVNRVAEYVMEKHDTDNALAMMRLENKIISLEGRNPDMTNIAIIRKMIFDADVRSLFYMICDSCVEGRCLGVARALDSLYPVKERNQNMRLLKDNQHQLQRLGLVEIVKEHSIFGESTKFKLTDKGKELYFEEDAQFYIEDIDTNGLILAKDIKEKRLFFSEKEREQLALIGETLEERNYKSLIERLETKGLSKGIAILLYGAPGTGKTESVMQWARTTGRDIMHVDISASKSMWYGESEKKVKDIFNRYKKLCERSSVKPILLFNEADGIFSKRKNIGNGGSVDQTENTIQNIILEEMENLEGILIATTNMVTNLDKAFERRFLFKIRFDKPTVEAKRSIWLDKLPMLEMPVADYLASRYDFSGGEIDNIVRKATMMEVIEGNTPSVESIKRICNEERLNDKNARVGFNV
ncbi:MAG: ATP-binding protein [Prevotellaceae bacterium]|nr:ATP-binding protein [Prevotellaceae bacterium]